MFPGDPPGNRGNVPGGSGPIFPVPGGSPRELFPGGQECVPGGCSDPWDQGLFPGVITALDPPGTSSDRYVTPWVSKKFACGANFCEISLRKEHKNHKSQRRVQLLFIFEPFFSFENIQSSDGNKKFRACGAHSPEKYTKKVPKDDEILRECVPGGFNLVPGGSNAIFLFPGVTEGYRYIYKYIYRVWTLNFRKFQNYIYTEFPFTWSFHLNRLYITNFLQNFRRLYIYRIIYIPVPLCSSFRRTPHPGCRSLTGLRFNPPTHRRKKLIISENRKYFYDFIGFIAFRRCLAFSATVQRCF